MEHIRKGMQQLAHGCLGGNGHAVFDPPPAHAHTGAPFCLLPIFDGLTARGGLSDEQVQTQMTKLRQQVCVCV